MTKEEIAYKETNFIFDDYELGITGLANAMDIFAKQECIEFAKFMFYNWREMEDTANPEYLYDLYLKSKNTTT